MEMVELGAEHRAQAVELWGRCGLTRPWNPPEADFDRAVAGATSAVLGALIDGRVAATVLVGDDGHRGWIYYLAVDPERRGRGLGRAAMAAAEAWLAARGVRKVELMVRASNHSVVALYAGLGYAAEPVTVLSRWLADPSDLSASPAAEF